MSADNTPAPEFHQALTYNLAQQVFEDWVADFEEHVGKKLILSLKPTKLIVPRSMFKLTLKILFYKPPIRKVKGMRARKRALYWRRK